MARKRAIPTGWLGGLGCGAVMMIDPATVLFLVTLLAPSILVRISDNRLERAGARAVFLCNVAAAIGPVCRLWHDVPPSLARALEMLSGMSAVAWAWLAGGLGWLVSEALIFGAGRWLALRDARAQVRLTEEIDVLVAEWGTPPKKSGTSS